MIFKRKKQVERKRPVTLPSDRKVYSYYGGNRSAKASPVEVKAKRKSLRAVFVLLKRWSLTRWVAVAGLFIFMGALVWVDTVPIIRVNSNDQPARQISEYRETAHKIISSTPLNRTKLTFNYVDVEKQFAQAYPEVAGITITFDLAGRKPVMQLSFHPPIMKIHTRGETWVIDNRGIAIAKEGDGNLTVGAVNLPTVEDQIGIGGEAGKSLLSATDVTYISTLLETIRLKGLPSGTLTIPLVPKEMDLQLAGEGYRTKFNLDEDVQQQIGTWLAARETLAARSELPNEYLDIRAGEKVYWK